MPDLNPEQRARQLIDAQLLACGWHVQDFKAADFSAGRGIALREVPLKTGPCDYLLLVDRRAVGIIEAKKQGATLSTVAEQSGRYANSLPDFLAAGVTGQLPFLYESTGVETLFRDERDPDPRSRRVFAFHRPETLAGWIAETDTLRRRLAQMPFAHPLSTAGMRACQVEAITGLEKSFAEDRPRALIHMATGAGKTFTACAFTYRLIKYAKARRVLFLVDRANLGEQARDEFHRFRTPDTGRLFTELYNVQHLTSPHIDDVCRVTICTIQRLYSILRGEELAEDADDLSGAELAATLGTRTRDVAYNPSVPIEKFDFIVTDECHRSIYNLWRQVLEYFDASLIGLTATPAPQTIAYFHQNRVAEYNHERAVTDGVNVGYDVYRIKTKVTEAGGKVDKGFLIDHRSKASRKARQDVLADDLDYTPEDLDRSVVVPDQIRTILRTYRDVVQTELFPGRTLVPKTLIFAKDDSHAEDIVHLCREVFGKGNDFCKKITYQAKHPVTGKPAKAKELIREFCLSPTLRIAVTVDMIATGTDIKPLEVLIFLRDVRSRVYFEQMKGRGTRVLSSTDLQSVSGEDARAKTRFVIVDAVGVCESDKTESRPLDREPTVSLKSLLQRVLFPGGRNEDCLTTLAARLARLDRELDEPQRQQIVAASGGQTPASLAGALLRAFDPDEVEAASRRLLESEERQQIQTLAHFFEPSGPVAITHGNLPHWRQDGATYFITFRLVDSLPAERIDHWITEREAWIEAHPEPVAEADWAEYHEKFSATLEHWLDQGSGCCLLELPECRQIVENAFRFFQGERYKLGEFVVASNHVHVLVTPLAGNDLSDILHSWKSFTAKEIGKVEEAARCLKPWWDNLHERRVAAAAEETAGNYSAITFQRPVWQKESFDHIVRSPESLMKFEHYIRNHGESGSGSGVSPLSPIAPIDSEEAAQKRRDAASTQLIAAACAPFDRPALRQTLESLKRETEQILDIYTPDEVLEQGFDAAAKTKAASLVQAFRDYLAQNQAQIDALQILYSRSYKQRLTERMLKELEKKLRDQHAMWTEDNLWNAFAAAKPGKVQGRSQAGRFADLVSLVRFALEQQPMLAPFADSVTERFHEWLMTKAETGVTFTDEQLAWLNLIRDHIATAISIEPEDLELSPFNQRGGLGKAHQLFGAQLPELLDELNETLAA